MVNVLDAREKRDAFEADLLREYGHPLITLRANYPGPVKGNLWSNYAVYRMFLNLRESFDILAVRHTYTSEGLIFFLLVDGKGEEIKRRCVALEDGRQLGRLLDIDVREEGRIWYRSELGYGPRRCFLCRDEAVYCVRSRRHDPREVADYFRMVVEEELREAGLKESLNRLTAFSLVNELCREFGYGCVTVNSNGSHEDMDFMTFIESIGALTENIGDIIDQDVKDFESLRAFGLSLEEEMFRRTGGINTHKGAVFTFVLLLAGFAGSERFSGITRLVAEVARPCLEDFDEGIQSHGLSIYRTLGIRGIRESAASGFSNIFETYLPLLEQRKDPESLFLTIMSMEEDTTVIHRSGIETLRELKERAALLRDMPEAADAAAKAEYRDRCQALDTWCVQHHISTGGSADILSASILMWMLKKNYHHLKGEI